jgi:hypothetical protein
MDLLGIAQQGLQTAQVQFDQSARNVVAAGLPDPTPSDSVSLSDAAVSLLSAKNQYQTDLGVAHVADEMNQATLNLLA